MLYERWCDTAGRFRDETALSDHGSRRHWTFGELRDAAERVPVPEGGVVFPQEGSAEFVVTLLAAWRAGKITCPIARDQSAPALPAKLPPCAHLKFTSGTTGHPRLIAFTAEQLAADVDNIVATMGLRHEWPNVGVISLAHSYGFSNLVLPLVLHGVPLILTSPLPEAFRQAIVAGDGVTVASVPALWRTWHDVGAITSGVRLAISAGAPLPVTLEQVVFNKAGLKIHNFYGASECGGIAYDASEQPRTDDAFAGTPLRNVALSVNDHGCLVVTSGAVGIECDSTTLPSDAVVSLSPSDGERDQGRGAESSVGLPDQSVQQLRRGLMQVPHDLHCHINPSPRPSPRPTGRGSNDQGDLIHPTQNSEESESHSRTRRIGDRRSVALNPDGICFVTSDLAELQCGNVFLRGRASDLINVAGRKLSPLVVEAALLRHAAVRQCVVFGVPSADANRVDEIAACVVAGHGTDAEELRRFLAAQIEPWQMPRHWRFVELLEADGRGKISRAAWRESFNR